MAVSTPQNGDALQRPDVLTLPEAALYLRVSKEAMEKLVVDRAVPARQIGGEWRFLKKALDDWLRLPDWVLHSPFAEELLLVLEDRLLHRWKQTVPDAPKPGTKQAVLQVYGVFQGDNDLEERLADIKARRKAGSGG
jgi:excisionase family DNA binding protein